MGQITLHKHLPHGLAGNLLMWLENGRCYVVSIEDKCVILRRISSSA